MLSRKVGECLVIDGNIRVYVTEIVNGGKVKLGIEADPSIPVHRGEIWDRIAEDRRPE